MIYLFAQPININKIKNQDGVTMSVKKIMVFLGSKSSEREVALRSGRAVSEALKRLGYTVETYDVQHEPLQKILDFQPDLVFLALHGKYGEDGTIQRMLEIMGMSDRIIVIGDGKVKGQFMRNEVTQEEILKCALHQQAAC